MNTLSRRKTHHPFKIISGGQTGVDRAALDVAIELGIDYGGWCPKGKLAEDGIIPAHYRLTETPMATYSQRTEWNVRDSDGTLIITQANILEGGTKLTVQQAINYHRPYFILDIDKRDAVQSAIDWIKINKIHTLNVAGPRASKSPNIYSHAVKRLKQLCRCLCS
jgi:hypothetical protein